MQSRAGQSLLRHPGAAVPDAHRAAAGTAPVPPAPAAPHRGPAAPGCRGGHPGPALPSAFPSQGGRPLSPHGCGTPCRPPEMPARRSSRTRLPALGSASPSSAPPPWPRSRRPQRTQRRAPRCACAAAARPAGRQQCACAGPQWAEAAVGATCWEPRESRYGIASKNKKRPEIELGRK